MQHHHFFFNFEVYNVSIEFVNLEDLDITRIAGVYKKTSYDHKRNFVGKIKRIFYNLGNKSRSFFFSVAAKRLMHGKRSRKWVDSREFCTDDRQPLKENNIVWYLSTRNKIRINGPGGTQKSRKIVIYVHAVLPTAHKRNK